MGTAIRRHDTVRFYERGDDPKEGVVYWVGALNPDQDVAWIHFETPTSSGWASKLTREIELVSRPVTPPEEPTFTIEEVGRLVQNLASAYWVHCPPPPPWEDGEYYEQLQWRAIAWAAQIASQLEKSRKQGVFDCFAASGAHHKAHSDN